MWWPLYVFKLYSFILWAFNFLWFPSCVAFLCVSPPYLCHLCHLCRLPTCVKSCVSHCVSFCVPICWSFLCQYANFVHFWQIWHPNVTHNVTNTMWHRWGGGTDDTDREATQMTQIGRRPSLEIIKSWKPKKWMYKVWKHSSGHHILSYHSAKNTPRAYVGKPNCFQNFIKLLLLTF